MVSRLAAGADDGAQAQCLVSKATCSASKLHTQREDVALLGDSAGVPTLGRRGHRGADNGYRRADCILIRCLSGPRAVGDTTYGP